MGLGLAFCKLAVRAHGGAIDFDSPAAGGTVFWFELPREGPQLPAER
jgi:signal transduction histidine kinase